jgi:ATP-dependent DNA helicase PIF1
MKKILQNKSLIERWQSCQVLIIDEISMLDCLLFELLDEIARTIRKEPLLPFGGIQVILVGDFMQLPPVRGKALFVSSSSASASSGGGGGGGMDNNINNNNNNQHIFAFESPIWETAGFNEYGGTINLRQVVRQDDEEFIRYLNEVRIGYYSQEFHQRLQSCLLINKPKPENGIIPTKLYATNQQVDDENKMHLQALSGDVMTMIAEDKWKIKPSKPAMAEYLRENIEKMIPEKIELKIGAQVMLLRNRSRMTFGGAIQGTGPSLVNGSRGRIVAFTESVLRSGMMVPRIYFDNGLEVTIGPVEYSYKSPTGDGEIIRYQVPLRLAWAATVHKSQGCTLTCAELMLDRTFDYGQAYVALSRVKNLEGLWLSKPLNSQIIKAHPAVLNFYGCIR